jgi:hypothetical protein
MFGWMVVRQLFESLKYRMICHGWDGDENGESVERLAVEPHRLPLPPDVGGASMEMRRDTL